MSGYGDSSAPAGGRSGEPGEERPREQPTRECVLLKHGEVFLKGRNRRHFEDRLHANLSTALHGVGGSWWLKNALGAPPGRGSGGVTVLGGEVPLDRLVERVRRVMGFDVVQPAVRVPSTAEEILAAAVRLVREAAAGERRSFAVRVRRRDKRFPLRSSELAAATGARVQRELHLPVDLTDPDVELRIEIDRAESYLSTERLAGQRGLPVGSSGRALVLLSGGYDSPVAAYRAMRRGLHCDFLHFTGAPYTDPSSAYKAYGLVRMLNRYQPAGRLYSIPLGTAQKELALSGAGKHQVIAQRRLMVRAACALAGRLERDALVSGDSLGQVSSQTLSHLGTVDDAASLPVLRPLLGWDKEEIIAEARRLGTYEVSALPDEDCCRLLAPERTATRTAPGHLAAVERRLGAQELAADLLDRVTCLTP